MDLFSHENRHFRKIPATEAARGATASAALLSKATARGAAADLAESGAPPRGGERLPRRETPPAGNRRFWIVEKNNTY